MVAVMVRVEDVFYRLPRNSLDVGHSSSGAAGIVGVHYDEVVLHLDDDVIAVPILIEVALPEPDARNDLLDGFKLALRSGGNQRHEGERDKRGAQPDPLLHRR